MPSFGEKLKQEREKRKITLEQISVSTKIGARMLQALEEDKFNQLPGGIFNKGFVRAYSRVVGLDEDQTVAEYLQASGDAPPVSTEIPEREDAARENAENIRHLEASEGIPLRQLPWGWFAAVLLVVALVLSLWNHHRQEQAKQPVRPASTAPTAGGAASGNSGSQASASGAPAASKITPASPELGAAAPATNSDDFQVGIHAREESWMSSTVDGKRTASEILPAGSERTLRGRREIVVKVGNAGGIEVRFNGKKQTVGGESGEVKTVTFGPRGILPNAPEPASAP